jgi:hypothetical protein
MLLAASRTLFRETVTEDKNASTYHRRIGATFTVHIVSSVSESPHHTLLMKGLNT